MEKEPEEGGSQVRLWAGEEEESIVEQQKLLRLHRGRNVRRAGPGH